MSPRVLHKTDVGGVKLNLRNVSEASRAYDEITEAVARLGEGTQVRGVLVSAMAAPGVEVIVGVANDPQMGHVITCGLGGVLVEVLKDVAIRAIPISRADALEMIAETRGYQLLRGFRGAGGKDVEAVAEILLNVSRLVVENPAIQELDLNPVVAHEKGATILDARMIVGDPPRGRQL